MTKYPLIDHRNFALATRDTGYKNTTAAIAELVDNAIQAGASRIAISVREEFVDGQSELCVAVVDDGSGMTAGELRRAVQWGGSSRFNNREGMGRFGMGLPNSSVSQARRLEVYTWRNPQTVYFTHLDVDEIAAGGMSSVPAPRRRRRPPWPEGLRSRSGTVVIWRKCDRLDCRRPSTLRRRLVPALGRIFRHCLRSGTQVLVDGTPVQFSDPLFPEANGEGPGARLHGDPLVYRVRPDGPGTPASVVTVRFARLPVAEWTHLGTADKRRMGIVGGAGVYVVRAGREIAHGWYFMDGKRRQNYDDWWRCEVAFEAPLDELMGVSHSKQGIRPGPGITAILAPDIGAIARRLSAEVRAEFSQARDTPAGAEKVADGRDWRLPRLLVPGAKRRLAATGARYEIGEDAWSGREFLRWEFTRGVLRISVNTNHAYHRRMAGALQNGGLGEQDVQLLLLAFARAATQAPSAVPNELVGLWSDALSAFTDD
jgi:hypothetical protein